MADPSSNPSIDIPAPINAEPESPSSDETQPSNESACTSAPGVSPTSETDLPEGNPDNLARHHTTLVVEEDIHERVTIAAEFPVRHLWSPFSTSSGPSFAALAADHIIFPPIIRARAHAELAEALSSSSQLSSVTPRPDSASPPKEPVITLYCPFKHTAGVIDALVCSMAVSERADVLVLDSLMFAQGKDSSLGPGQ